MLREERFKIDRFYRKAKRGYGIVQDGWDLTDTLTGSKQHFTIKAEANERIDRTLNEEANIDRSKVVSWDADLEYRSMTPNVEVSFYDAGGNRLGSFALVERAYAPLRVVEWLRAMGLADLPRRVTV